MDGSPGSQNYLVTGSRDLEQPVQPGGSTTHAEHARGLTNVIIENNECRKSIFAGGVDGMIIRGNTVEDRTVCNSCTNLLIADNSVRSNANPGDLVEPGYTRGLPVRGNTVLGAETNPIGLYVWGARVTTASLAWMY